MIRFEQVTKVLGGREVLSDLTFEIRKGEVFTIVGSSGSGKSVTLKHIVRLLTPTSGAVWVGDTEVSAAGGRKLEKVREHFGYLFQGGALLGWMSVYENVALPLREKTHLSSAAIDKRVMEVLKMVGLENDGGKLPSLAALQTEHKQLTERKTALNAEYKKLEQQAREYGIIKRNVDSILTPGDSRGKTRERDAELL